jgi:hypothetical protein
MQAGEQTYTKWGGAPRSRSQFKYYNVGGAHSGYLGAALWGNPHELGRAPKKTNCYVYVWLSESAVGYANLGWGGAGTDTYCVFGRLCYIDFGMHVVV